MPFIYKIINLITQDFYIGKTTQSSVNKRWNQHKSNSNLNKQQNYNNKFYNAIRKYGHDTFEISILEETLLDYLDDREIYWINKLQPTYNTSEGGRITSGFKGKVLTEKHKNNLIYSNSYPVYQYDLEGNFIKEWKYIADAIKYYKTRAINHAVNNKQHTSVGFRWFKEYHGDKILPYKLIGHKAKKVYRIDDLGNKVLYESALSAELEGFYSSEICVVCQGKRKQHKGFKWEYAE